MSSQPIQASLLLGLPDPALDILCAELLAARQAAALRMTCSAQQAAMDTRLPIQLVVRETCGPWGRSLRASAMGSAAARFPRARALDIVAEPSAIVEQLATLPDGCWPDVREVACCYGINYAKLAAHLVRLCPNLQATRPMA